MTGIYRRFVRTILAAVIGISLVAGLSAPSGATIGVDASSGIQGNSSSFTWQHTVANRLDRALFVGVSIFSGNKSVAGVTYAGQPLTLVGAQNGGSGSKNRRVEVWYILMPAAGTDNIVVTMSNGSKVVAGATSFYGVNQTTPLGPFVSNQGSGTGASVAVVSAADEVVFDCLTTKGRAVSVTAGTGQTQLWNDVTRTNGGNVMGAASHKPGAPSVTMSWTLGKSEYWVIGAVPLRPAPPPPYLVDSMIKLSTEGGDAYLTDDLYESTALAQVKTVGVLSGATATYDVLFENDGLNADQFLVTGTAAANGFTVQYLDGSGIDRTADVTGAGYLDATVPSGGSILWTVLVTPNGSPNPAPGGSAQAVSITATSTGDPLRIDQVEATTTSTSPLLAMNKSADRGTAAPGEDITYSIAAASGSGFTDAISIVVVDTIPASTGFRMGSATFAPGTSGLTSSVNFSNDGGASWTYVPSDGACGAPAGYDYCVTHVRWVLAGAMPAARTFSVGLAVRVK